MDIDLNIDSCFEEDVSRFDEIFNKTSVDDLPLEARKHLYVEGSENFHSEEEDINEEHDHSSPKNDGDIDPTNFENSLKLALEKRLEVGSVLESVDQAYLLYCEYGRLTGFSVKKGTQDYFYKTTDIRLKNYNCSCHGQSNQMCSKERLAAYRKQVSRSHCKAKLLVVRERKGPWKVQGFQKEHNHELVPPDQSYMLRSCRQLSHANKSLLEALNSAGIRMSSAYMFMEKESGGSQNVGFIRKDAYNYINGFKMKTKVENGDADALLQFFIKKSNTEDLFYWNVQTDDDKRIMNFFYRDSRSANDYKYFGDVLSVDTTQGTNKYGLHCVPFVGVNHHMKNVLFGMGFLSHQTSISFDWLFSTFLESMSGKEPEVIFSDEDRALMRGIDMNFKTASHRLCQWHINRNAPSHFGSLKGDTIFKNMWHRCMNGCENEEQFELQWKEMIEKYKKTEDKWFQKMYRLKRRWSSAFTTEKFCAGLHATSRSEVTNKVIKDLCAASGCLHDFVIRYEEILKNWRQRESEDDTLCIGLPGQMINTTNNKLLQHAAKYFTRSVFKLYEREATHSINVRVVQHPKDYSMDELEFIVSADVDYGRPRTLNFNKLDRIAKCSCKLWETSGVLCRHIFKVFYSMDIFAIPSRYLLSRLSRKAKQRNFSYNHVAANALGAHSTSNLSFVSYVMRETYDFVEFARNHPESRDLILQNQAEIRAKIYRNMGKDPTHVRIFPTNEGLDYEGVQFCNPPEPEPKHVQTRNLGHWDEPKGTRKRTAKKIRKGDANNLARRKKKQMPVSTSSYRSKPCFEEISSNTNLNSSKATLQEMSSTFPTQ